jgi:hypothetical protein
MKLIICFIDRLFNRSQSQYGPNIFRQQSWLDKQVEEAQWKRRFLVD